MDILSYILGQKNALNKSETSDTTVTIYDGNVVFATIPESDGMAYNAKFIPSTEPVTGKDITVIFNGQTYTLQDVSEITGDAAWAIFAGAQLAIAVGHIVDPEEWAIQILTSLMPSQDETQTLPVVITQIQSSSGSSDLSTATITITENGSVPGLISAPIVYDDVNYSSGVIETIPLDTVQWSAILLEGEAEIHIPKNINVISTSGGIEDLGGGYYAVTGDCTITVESSDGTVGGVYYGKAYSGNGIIFDIASGNPLPENITTMSAVYGGNFTVESGIYVSAMQMDHDTYNDNWDSYVTYIEIDNNKPRQRMVFRDLVIDFDTEGEISITYSGSELINHDNYNNWVLYVI